MTTRARLRYAVAAMVVLVVAGTVGYRLVEGWGWFDSLYMTVITLSTVGFREVMPLSEAGRVFTVLLILFGLGTVTFAARQTFETLFQFDPRFVQRRTVRRVRRRRNHLVLCGAGRTGDHILRWCRAGGEEVVVVEQDTQRAADLRAQGHLVILGDAREEEILAAAGVDRARAMICALDHDADSLFTVLTARAMSGNLRICARSQEEGGARRLLKAGADWAVSGTQLGAERLTACVLKPRVTEMVETYVRGEMPDLLLGEFAIRAGSPLAQKRLAESGLRSYWNILVVAIRKHGVTTLTIPRGDTLLEEGDRLVAIGRPETLRGLVRGERAGI